MMETKLCIFWQSVKKMILGNMGAEYAPDRENAAEIPMGNYGFWRLSDAQNGGNLDFSAFFESFHFQVNHTSKWANSDRISLMWSILKSERSFEIFEIFEKSSIPIPDMPRFRHLR
tara:strand:+ start:119 stop:466 length:348 start_codon:yes stop_codon:yes gene_type:complete